MNNGVTNNINNNPVSTNNNVASQPVMPVANNSAGLQPAAQQPVMVQTQPAVQTPQIVQSIPVQADNTITPPQPQQSQQPVIISQDQPNSGGDNSKTANVRKQKKNINLVPILVAIILILIAYTVFSYKSHKDRVENLMYNCTPITASKEEIKLDLDSTLVKSLYSKVATNIREDLAQPEFNDNMRLYLAYRQILESDKYDSNCNLFDKLSMEPFTCEVSTSFVPKAFKEETLTQAVKELYGESTSIPFANIRLGNSSCIGGYQYIPSRGEFVQGKCGQQTATSYRVTKTLKEAVSTRNTIILTEEVKYHENEKMALPEYLKNGLYYYTFRLDMNYNYVLVSKTYESKY